MGNMLRSDVEKSETTNGWSWSLDYYYKEALREIPIELASRAVSSNKPVQELMEQAAANLLKIKADPSIELLAARWQVKLDQEASGARK